MVDIGVECSNRTFMELKLTSCSTSRDVDVF